MTAKRVAVGVGVVVVGAVIGVVLGVMSLTAGDGPEFPY